MALSCSVLFHSRQTLFFITIPFIPVSYIFVVSLVMHDFTLWLHFSFIYYYPFVMQTNTLLYCLVTEVALFKPPLYVLSFISQAHYLDKVVKGTAFLLFCPPPFVTPASINTSFTHPIFFPFMDICKYYPAFVSLNHSFQRSSPPINFLPFCHTVIST